LRELYFAGTIFLRIANKTAKVAKIRTRKNLVPHGSPKARANVHFYELAFSWSAFSEKIDQYIYL